MLSRRVIDVGRAIFSDYCRLACRAIFSVMSASPTLLSLRHFQARYRCERAKTQQETAKSFQFINVYAMKM